MQMLMQAAESRARVKVKKETERQKREEEAWGGVCMLTRVLGLEKGERRRDPLSSLTHSHTHSLSPCLSLEAVRSFVRELTAADWQVLAPADPRRWQMGKCGARLKGQV